MSIGFPGGWNADRLNDWSEKLEGYLYEVRDQDHKWSHRTSSELDTGVSEIDDLPFPKPLVALPND